MPRTICRLVLLVLLSAAACFAASKPHVISYGRTMNVKVFIGPDEKQSEPMAVRALYVDGKLRDFSTGDAHDITDRLFVIRRAFRVNNTLPNDDDPKKLPDWAWQKGGWLMVDRQTGRVSQVALPQFDPYYSDASWFRDYVAYCGLSDDQDHLYAVVAQIGRKKPLLLRELGIPSNDPDPLANCTAPTWEKQPTKVTFHPKKSQEFVFTVTGHSLDAAPGSTDED